MSSISLDNVWVLWIIIPLIFLISVPFAVVVNRDNRNFHNVASCVLHICMAVVVAFAAAGVSVETTLTETNVYVVADVSYSANRNLDVIDGYIKKLQGNLPANSKLGVVCFGKDYTVLTGLGEEFTSVSDASVDDSQTDIVSALKYTGSIFKSNVIKRIVLITDAMQTGMNGDSELKQTVDELVAADITVDAIYLDDNITDDVPEVQVTGVSCSQTTYSGREAPVTVTVQSTQAALVTLSVYADGELEECVETTVYAGTSEISFSLSGDREPGLYSYSVVLSAENDRNPYNNSCSFTQQVEGSIRVLFITDESADAKSCEELFAGTEVEPDIYCNEKAVPYTVSDICLYDIIVLSSVNVSRLDNYAMFIDSLDVAVSLLGKSLIASGDLGLQTNPDDEALSKLADMLPVNYGNTVRDSKLYIMLLDCSHSVFYGSKMGYLKEAAEAVIKLLNEDDQLLIYKFYSENSILYYGEVGDGSDALYAVENLESLQGTVVRGGFESVINNYMGKESTYGSMSILLVSDGLSHGTPDEEYTLEYATKLNENGIGTSVIDIGMPGGYSNGERVSEGSEFLKKIAVAGGGSYFWYYYSYGAALEEDILPAISNEVGEDMVDGVPSPVSLSYKNYTDSVLDGLKSAGYITSSTDGLSYIEGYVVGSAKSSATTVLTTEYTKSTGAKTDVPVYSYWNYGNGRTASFMSSLSGDWVSQWVSRGILSTLFYDMVTTAVPSARVDTPYLVTVNKSGDGFTVEVAPVEVKAGAKVTVTVTNPDGTVNVLSNVVFDSTVFTGSFEVEETGTYRITVEYEYGGTVYNSFDYYADVSYLAEYDSFANFDSSSLYKAIGANGTVSEDGELSIVNDESRISKRIVSLTVPLLIAAVSLFVADIVIRKLKWRDIVGLFRKVNRGRKA